MIANTVEPITVFHCIVLQQFSDQHYNTSDFYLVSECMYSSERLRVASSALASLLSIPLNVALLWLTFSFHRYFRQYLFIHKIDFFILQGTKLFCWLYTLRGLLRLRKTKHPNLLLTGSLSFPLPNKTEKASLQNSLLCCALACLPGVMNLKQFPKVRGLVHSEIIWWLSLLRNTCLKSPPKINNKCIPHIHIKTAIDHLKSFSEYLTCFVSDDNILTTCRRHFLRGFVKQNSSAVSSIGKLTKRCNVVPHVSKIEAFPVHATQ